MNEILGPAFNLRLYETSTGFDESGLMADLGYFVREHGPDLARQLLPGIPRELLTCLQYAPDEFSYRLVGDRLVAAEDMKQGRLVDIRSRINRQEPERGAGVHNVMSRIAAALADEKTVADGQMLAWLSPKEGFSQHAYLNVAAVTRDDLGRRTLIGRHYMSDFTQADLLQIVANLGGEKIPPNTSPRLVSRMLFSILSQDVIDTCEQIPAASGIGGMPIRRLWGKDSKSIWQIIRQVVAGSERQIARVIHQAQERVDRMKDTMAAAALGLIVNVLQLMDYRDQTEAARGGAEWVRQGLGVDKPALMAAFATAVAGCVGFGGVASTEQVISPVRPLGQESDMVHCPNCNQKVHCAIGERCPGCRQVRPC